MTRERLLRSALLLAVLLIALVLRVWRLETLPPGLYHDEAYNGLDALSLMQGKTFPQFYEGWELYAAEAHEDQPAMESRWPLFFEGNYGREPLHIYLMALSFKLFGVNALAIRVVPALAGVFGVLTTYLAAKELTAGRKKRTTNGKSWQSALRWILLDPALVAAVAMAVLFPAVHFSRFGVRAMLFVPIATLTVTLFWHGINRAGGSDDQMARRLPVAMSFLVAGFLMGLAVYSYAVARLFPLVFVIFVPFWFWRDRSALHRHWRHVVVMAGAAFLTALPLLIFFARYPYYFVFRIAYVANKGKGTVEGQPWLTWIRNVARVVRGLFVVGETHLRHNLPGRPYMDPIQSVLFLSGAVVTLRQRLQPKSIFLWVWLLVMLLPSIFSGDAPHFGRLSGVAPVVAIFIGVGWAGLVRLLSERSSKRAATMIIGIFGVAVLASVLWTTYDYFVRYANHPGLPDAFYQSDWELGAYLAGFPEVNSLYLTPSQEELATIYLGLGTVERLTDYTATSGPFSGGIVPAGVPGQSTLYVVRPSNAGYIDRLKAVFPGGTYDAGREAFLSYYVAGEDNRLNIDNEVGFSWSNEVMLAGWSHAWQGDQLVVTLVWQAGSELDRDYTAFVHVLDDAGEIVAQVDRPPAGYPTGSWRPGEVVMDSFVVSLPPGMSGEEITLQTGFYSLPALDNIGAPVTLGRFVVE